jgi:hypothetical protein
VPETFNGRGIRRIFLHRETRPSCPQPTLAPSHSPRSDAWPSPARSAPVKVTLKIKSQKVTSVKVTAVYVDSGEKEYESSFAKGISKVVVGKKPSTLSVSRVGGSSLTSGGFNAAVKTIRAHAKK